MTDTARINETRSTQAQRYPGFNPLHIVIPALIVLVLIGFWIRWYARAVSIPRYCADPQKTVRLLERVIDEERPAGDGAHRPYLVAAKLLFLVPRRSNESVPRYLNRITRYLRKKCV